MSQPHHQTATPRRIAGATLAAVLMLGGGGTAACADNPAPTSRPSSPAGAPPPSPPGPPRAQVVRMPELVDLNAAVAIDKLEKLGFARQSIKLTTQDENDWFVVVPQNWTVEAQSEAPGVKLPNDSVVVLTCTKNP
jgi:hypothetical protein